MPALKFPVSSTPGKLPGEGEGRRINAYLEKAGDSLYLRRCPGLATFAETGGSGPRGMIEVNGTVYGAWANSAFSISVRRRRLGACGRDQRHGPGHMGGQ
jgi:hypothetical protein